MKHELMISKNNIWLWNEEGRSDYMRSRKNKINLLTRNSFVNTISSVYINDTCPPIIFFISYNETSISGHSPEALMMKYPVDIRN
jgi:hypothetical protein